MTTPALQRRWLAPALIVLVALVLVVTVLLRDNEPDAPAAPAVPSTAGQGPAERSAGQTPDLLTVERRDPEDPLAVGDVDAPVTMVVYSDYQCPYCALWVRDTQPTMLEYVASGDLRIEWRDVNVFGADSVRGAQAAYAAGLQGEFWNYHGRLLDDGQKASPEDLTVEALTALAAESGLDVEKFTADLASPEVAAAVTANSEEGLSIGAYSTPSFIVGGRPVIGAQPVDVFVAAVEDALAQAR